MESIEGTGQSGKQSLRNVIDAMTPRDRRAYLDSIDLDEVIGVDPLIDSQHQKLRDFLSMAKDRAWSLPPLGKKRIAATFRYVSKSREGALETAEWSMMRRAAVDLLEQDCRAEMTMYKEYCELKNSSKELPFKVESRGDWLRYKREELSESRARRFLGMRRSKIFG